jgi:glucose-1-phosphatase
MNRTGIRNIIFDLGGVLISLDVQEAINGITALGIRFPYDEQVREKFMGLLRLFEVGRISPSGFRNEMRALTTVAFEDEAFDRVWTSMLVDYSPVTIGFLLELKKKYRLFLLSNTNVLHVPHFREKLTLQTGAKMEDIFEKVFYSHVLGMRKPDREIYEYVLKDGGLDPEETLFIDDMEENVIAARGLGIIGHHLVDGETPEGILPRYIEY